MGNALGIGLLPQCRLCNCHSRSAGGRLRVLSRWMARKPGKTNGFCTRFWEPWRAHCLSYRARGTWCRSSSRSAGCASDAHPAERWRKPNSFPFESSMSWRCCGTPATANRRTRLACWPEKARHWDRRWGSSIMAVTCPRCGGSFDATLFDFGHRVQCHCGAEIALSRGKLQTVHTADTIISM
jgi:hypothetical protein